MSAAAAGAVSRQAAKAAKHWPHKSPTLTVRLYLITRRALVSPEDFCPAPSFVLLVVVTDVCYPVLVGLFLLLLWQHALDNKPKLVLAPEHDEPMGSWSSEKIRQSVTESVMLTWAPGKARYVVDVSRFRYALRLVNCFASLCFALRCSDVLK